MIERLDITGIRDRVGAARAAGKSIALVPTMGALHEGHLSLIRRAAGENGFTVVSIFVNPIQFDDPTDFEKYPQTLGTDMPLAEAAGAGAVFAPSAKEMYPDGFSSFIDMTGITGRLCGASRPSHFRGVCTVVGKLFHIVLPDRAYFGEKDAQQLAVVRKMVRELDFPVEVIGCPTVREADGLAMSSRNGRLSPAERQAALSLSRALATAQGAFAAGERDAGKLKALMRAEIEKEPLARIDYVEIVEPSGFGSVATATAGSRMALAVFIGGTRLIDNAELTGGA
ncbi:MAG: pantoate--beta-alanine ligase [Clostridiales Family XIII bacterium]|jgi:pantoate--beta-alanine ligase|nr:pantoate--beta-alanine ligase [Clostridiales Family XIII bacterium]